MEFLTTLAGALPRGAELTRARWMRAQEELDPAALAAEEDRARRAWLQFQREAGVDFAVDPQVERADLLGAFADAFDGCELVGLARCADNRYARRARVEGPIVRGAPVALPGWRKAVEAAGATDGSGAIRSGAAPRPAVTGPCTLAAWTDDEHYGAFDAVARAFAAAVAEEVRDLVEAGAEDVQLDEPVWTGREDGARAAAGRAALEAAIAPARGKARIWLHAGFGALDADPAALVALPCDVLLLDVAGAGADRLERLGPLPDGKRLAAGVLDGTDPALEDVATVRGRIEELARRLQPDRLWLTPGGGLHALHPDRAKEKIHRLVESVGPGRS